MKLVYLIMSAVVGILLIGAVLVPIINNDPANEGWKYDDYREADGVASASGALELITVGSTEYIHASNVGNGTITYTNGTTESVIVNKADLCMLFIMGQSNGEYLTQYADPSAADPVPALGEAYYYGTDSSPTIKEYDAADCAMHDMIDSDGSLIVGDIWPSLAASFTDDCGKKAYVVSAAWGGKSITEFTPETGEIWQYSVQVLSDAIDAVNTSHYNLVVNNYIWIQGEADENMVKNEYINRFAAMNAAIMSGGLGVDTINACFISKVREERAPVIAEAEIEICETIDNVHMACQLADGFTYDNGYRADYSHYTQAGDNLIGAAVGAYIADHYYPDIDGYDGLMAVIPAVLILALISALAFSAYRRE